MLEVNNLNAVDEDDKVGSPAGYVPYDIDNDGNSTTYYELPTGELWYLPDFLNDIQMVDQSVDTVYSTAGVASENVTPICQLVLQIIRLIMGVQINCHMMNVLLAKLQGYLPNGWTVDI